MVRFFYLYLYLYYVMEGKQKIYLDKIVDILFRGTEVGAGWFNAPYYMGGGKSSAGRSSFELVYLDTFGLLSNNYYSGLHSHRIYFENYCGYMYGLTDEELDYVWIEYMNKLYESYDWGFLKTPQ
jgi:hypothetical protein